MIDGIIFNLGNTLIDETTSYRSTIEVTVNNFVNQTAVDSADIALLKSIPGFANDWDTSFVLVDLIKHKIPKDRWKIEAVLRLPVDRSTVEFKAVYDFFQACFLGSGLYRELEGKPPKIDYDPGMIKMSQSLIETSVLGDLASIYPLTILTECPRAEVRVLLEQTGLKSCFDLESIVAQGECPSPTPDPSGLLLAAENIGAQKPLYVGDSGSDFAAAERAGIPFLYVPDGKTNELVSHLLL